MVTLHVSVPLSGAYLIPAHGTQSSIDELLLFGLADPARHACRGVEPPSQLKNILDCLCTLFCFTSTQFMRKRYILQTVTRNLKMLVNLR